MEASTKLAKMQAQILDNLILNGATEAQKAEYIELKKILNA
jgi:hypothetical protein